MNRARVRWTALGIVVAVVLASVFLAGVTASPAFAEDRGKSGLPSGPGSPHAKLQQEINALAQQIAELAKLGVDVTALTQQVAALQQQMTALAALQQQVNGLNGQVVGLSSQVADLAKLGQAVTALTQQVTALQQQMTAAAALQQQVNGMYGQVVGLNNQVAGLNNQVADLTARLQAMGSSSSLSVYDALGTKIGDVIGVQDEIPWVSFSAGGQVLALRVFSGHLVGGSVWFTGAGCQGTPYISDPSFFNGADTFSVAGVRDPGGLVFAALPGTPRQRVVVQSVTQSDGS